MNKNKHYYIIEENVKNPKMFELKTIIYNDNYIRFNQNSLKDFIGKMSFKMLLRNGLFMNKKDRKYNATLSLHRLIGCIYSDISGMEIHHINKNKSDNRFENLVPLESEINTSIDSLPIDKMLEFGKRKHKEWVQTINRNKRATITNNDLLIFEILVNSINKTSIMVHKLYKRRIKSIKAIRKILNTYFYKEEFLKFLKRNKINIFDN